MEGQGDEALNLGQFSKFSDWLLGRQNFNSTLSFSFFFIIKTWFHLLQVQLNGQPPNISANLQGNTGTRSYHGQTRPHVS